MSSITAMPDPDLEENYALHNNISHSVAMVRTIPTYDTATYMDAQIDDLYEDGGDLQEDGNVSSTTIEASDDILIFDWNIFYLGNCYYSNNQHDTYHSLLWSLYDFQGKILYFSTIYNFLGVSVAIFDYQSIHSHHNTTKSGSPQNRLL